jgi:hypothetical protein
VTDSGADEADELYGVVFEALAHQARGEDFDAEALQDALTFLACVPLLRGGLGFEELERLFSRGHTFRVKYDGDELTIVIDWDEGEPDEVTEALSRDAQVVSFESADEAP